jgi:hypothetical protein
MRSCPWSIWNSFRCRYSNIPKRSFGWIAIKIHNKINYLKVPTYDKRLGPFAKLATSYPADEAHHIDKFAFQVPFVCGARNLGEALRRIGEGAAMIRTKGEAGSGNIVEAVRHMRAVQGAMKRLTILGPEELMAEAKELGAPYEIVKLVAKTGTLNLSHFVAR